MQSEEILEACFQVDDFKDHEMKQEMISQFLHQKTVPKSIVLPSTVIDFEAKKANWFANQALLYLYTPVLVTDDKELAMSSYGLNTAFTLNPNEPCAADMSKIISLATTNSRKTLVARSFEMYSSARDILLNPFMYEQIAHNKELVKTIFSISQYLTARGMNIEEAQILSSASRVYRDREYKKLKRIGITGRDRDEVWMEGMFLEKISGISNNIIFTANVTDAATRRLFTERDLKKFLKRATKAFDVIFCPGVFATSFHVKKAGLDQLYQIVKKGVDMTSTQLYLHTSKHLRSSEPWISAEKSAITFWSFQLFTFDLFVLNVARAKYTEGENLFVLKKLCYDSAKEMTDYLSSNLASTAHSGARLVPVLYFITDMFVERSNELCAFSESRDDLNDCLHYFNLVLTICNYTFEKHQSDVFSILRTNVEEHINILQDRISFVMSFDIGEEQMNPLDIDRFLHFNEQ